MLIYSHKMYSTVAQDAFHEEDDEKLEPLSFYPTPPNPPRDEMATIRPIPIRKSQKCEICGKVLSSPSSHYVHMKSHSQSKPFQCLLCDVAFCRKPYLEVHMRTHTGERPFQCVLCLKRFTQKSSLNTHKRVHTGERPYKCEICNKRFAVKSYVMAHRWSHVSDHPVNCNYCSETFTSHSAFEEHTKTHINYKFECPTCAKTFARESYLVRHQVKVHGRCRQNVTEDSSYLS